MYISVEEEDGVEELPAFDKTEQLRNIEGMKEQMKCLLTNIQGLEKMLATVPEDL